MLSPSPDAPDADLDSEVHRLNEKLQALRRQEFQARLEIAELQDELHAVRTRQTIRQLFNGNDVLRMKTCDVVERLTITAAAFKKAVQRHPQLEEHRRGSKGWWYWGTDKNPGLLQALRAAGLFGLAEKGTAP